jgi:murein DD-endopeptidase MepM/ murein hydrolase activator NlpD
MKAETYTLFMASNRRGTIRKITVPLYVLYLSVVLAVVGGISVAAAVGSYTRMLWKVGNYNVLRRKQDALQQQYRQLQNTVKNTDERLSSLQSLATDVAMTYGLLRQRDTPFAVAPAPAGSQGAFEDSVAQFNFLEKNATSIAVAGSGLRLVPALGLGLGEMTYTPTLWPVIGQITARFGERLDPFNGEGEFHTGVDISANYGTPVRATADGVVIEAREDAGYGRLVVVDHGFGVTSWYAHLSSFTVLPGSRVKRGDVIGYVGVSGRTTGPHVHYEVRINGAPVNPMRFLRYADSGAGTVQNPSQLSRTTTPAIPAHGM